MWISGVGAMETVMQGNYRQLMDIVEKAQEACINGGADEVVVTLKVHAKKDSDVSWEEKLEKYS